MKKMLALAALTLLALTQSGCSSCNRPFMNWFNRGDDCNTAACAPPGCAPGGGWQTRGFAPSAGPMVLPGPIEVAPVQ